MIAAVSKVSSLLWLGLQMAQATELDPQSVLNAKTFLTAYLNTTNTGNSDLLKLYSDAATITVNVITLDRTTKVTDFSGQAWKRLLHESWTSGKSVVEPVELHNVRIQGNGANLEIAAQRYSQNRCYWDTNYNMVITNDTSGHYQIIKENRTIDHKNQCPIPDSLTIKQNININQHPQP
jgi:hypothetical protein